MESASSDDDGTFAAKVRMAIRSKAEDVVDEREEERAKRFLPPTRRTRKTKKGSFECRQSRATSSSGTDPVPEVNGKSRDAPMSASWHQASGRDLFDGASERWLLSAEQPCDEIRYNLFFCHVSCCESSSVHRVYSACTLRVSCQSRRQKQTNKHTHTQRSTHTQTNTHWNGDGRLVG